MAANPFDQFDAPAPNPDETPPNPFDQFDHPRSALGEIGAGLKRGFFQGVAGAGAVLQTPSERAGVEPGAVANLGKSLEEYGTKKAAMVPAQTETHGPVTRFFTAAAEAPGASLPFFAGAFGGAAAGGAVAGPPGAVVGGALGGGTAQGLQTWHEKYREAIDVHHMDPDRAKEYADQSAITSGELGAAMGAVGPAAGAVGRAVGLGAKTATEAAARATGTKFLPEFAKEAGGITAINTGFGAAGAAAQAAIDREAGISDKTPGEAALESIPAGLGGSVGFFPFAIMGARHGVARASELSKAMSDPTVAPDDRIAAAGEIYQAMAAVDQASADRWARNAARGIDQKQPVGITPDWVAGPHPSLRGPLEDAAQTAHDTGAAAGAEEARRGPIEEAQLAQYEESIRKNEPELTDEEVQAKVAEAAQKPREEAERPPGPLMPFDSVETAQARADLLKAKTGEDYEVIPHPYARDRFAVVPKGEEHAGVEGQRPEGGVGEHQGTDAGVQGQGEDRNEHPGEREEGAEAGGGDRTGHGTPVVGGPREPGGPHIEPGTVDEGAHGGASSPHTPDEEPTPGEKEAGNYKKGHTEVSGLGLSIENPEDSQRSNLDTDRVQKAFDSLPDDIPGRVEDHFTNALKAAKEGDYSTAHDLLGKAAGELDDPEHPEWQRGASALDDILGKTWVSEMRGAHYGYIATVDGEKGPRGRDKDHVDTFVKPGTEPDWKGKVYIVDMPNQTTGAFDEHKVFLGYASAMQAHKALRENYPEDFKHGEMASATFEDFKNWLKTGDTTKPFVEPKVEKPKPPEVEGEPKPPVGGPREPPGPPPGGEGTPPTGEGGGAEIGEPEAPKPPEGEAPKPEEPKAPKPPPTNVTVNQAKKAFEDIVNGMEDDEKANFEGATWRTLDGAPHVIGKDGSAYHFVRLDRAVLAKEGFVSVAAQRRARGGMEIPDAMADAIAAQDHQAIADRLYEGTGYKPTRDDWPQIHPESSIIRIAVDPNHQKQVEENAKRAGFRITDRATPIASDSEGPRKITISAIYRPDKGHITDTGEQMAGQRKGTPDFGKETDADEQQIERLLESVSKATILDARPEHGSFGSFMFREALFNRLIGATEFIGKKFEGWQTRGKPKQALVEALKAGRRDEIQKVAETYAERLKTLMETLEKPERVGDLARALRDKYLTSDGQSPNGTYGEGLARLMPNSRIASVIEELEGRYGANEDSTDQTNREVKLDPRVPPRLENIVRVGMKDHREGKNVEADDFLKAFGFRGVEFGNWVNQIERQENLNLAFDGLHDLVDQLGGEPKLIGLAGDLGLAFGARGRGRASAHFEPDNNVINLTRNKGNGTVAHEWMHALEDRLRKADVFDQQLTEGLRETLKQRLAYEKLDPTIRTLLKSESGNAELRNIPPKMAALTFLLDGRWGRGGYDSLYERTGFYNDAREMDEGASERYWSTPHELVARGWEATIYDELKGGSPYLVGPTVADGHITPKNGYKGTPYPIGEERKYIAEQYHNFMAALNLDTLKAEPYKIEPQVRVDALGRFHVFDQMGLPVTDSVFKTEVEANRAVKQYKGQDRLFDSQRAQLAAGWREAWSLAERMPKIMEELGIREYPEVKNGSMAESMFYHMRNGWWPEDNAALVNFAKQAFRVEAVDNLKLKQAQEDFEAAAARYAAQRITDMKLGGADDRAIFDYMTELYKKQPNLDVRTSTSMANQGYSTPLPISWIANLLVRAGPRVKGYDPTTGNGMLVIGLNPKNVIANELEHHRAENLKLMQYGAVHEGDALTAAERKVFRKQEADVVLANPPFGALPKEVEVDGYRMRAIDQLIAAHALAAMKDDGRAVLIMGANKEAGVISPKDRPFLNWLYSNYNVADHFEVDGKLYSRQGASWPLRILVIAGRQASDRLGPESGTIERVGTFDDLWTRYVQADSNSEKVLVGSVRAPAGAGGAAGRPGALPGGGAGEGGEAGAGHPAGGGPEAGGNVLRPDGERHGQGESGRGEGEPAPIPGNEQPAGGGRPGEGGTAGGGVRGRGGKGAGGSAAGGRAGGDAELGNLTPEDLDDLLGLNTSGPSEPPKARKGKGKTAAPGAATESRIKGYTVPEEPADEWRSTVDQLVKARPFFDYMRIDPADGRWQLGDGDTLRFAFYRLEGRTFPFKEGKFIPGPHFGEFLELHGIEHADGSYTKIKDGLYQIGAGTLDYKPAKPPRLIDEADHDALTKLFGAKGGKLALGDIDNQIYDKTKPIFQRAWDRIVKAVGDFRAAIARFRDEMVSQYNERILPYLKAFLTEKIAEAQRPKGKRPIVDVEQENDLQVVYSARSKGPSAGIFAPRQQAAAMQRALDQLEAKHADEFPGGIDDWLAHELGYGSREEMWYGPTKNAEDLNGLSGYQVDATALAIDKMNGGDGFIVGDDTGVGKGRVAAALVRWAAKNGKIPVFMTVSDDLYSDHYRDLKAIGSTDLKLVMSNTDARVVDEDTRKVIGRNIGDRARVSMQHIIDNGTLPNDGHVLLTTYSQLNVPNARRDALRRLVADGKAVLVMDEAHKASGESGVGAFIQELLTGNNFQKFPLPADWTAPPTTYLSATFAKRADNLPVYARTHIRYIGQTMDDVKATLESGGPLLQQVVSRMLIESGQMLRRERSYANLKVNYHVDTENGPRDARHVDAVTDVLRSIVRADRALEALLQSPEYVRTLLETLLPPGANIHDKVKALMSAINKNPYTSVVHNTVAQLLLATKLEKAIGMGMEALNRGERPIFTLHNTMESMLENYTRAANIKPGDVLKDFGWNSVTQRSLDNTRRLTYEDAQGVKHKIVIPLNMLPKFVRDEYDKALAKIGALKSPLSAAPIDTLRQTLSGYVKWKGEDGRWQYGPKAPEGKEGKPLVVSEVTARNLMVDFSGEKPVLRTRSDPDKFDIIRDYQDGKIDALILNSAGSTGISLHAAAKAKNQLARHMIVLQPSPDISIFKQTLGRINRTGQVEYPLYTVLASDVPSEKRPMAMLKKKMKSLISNTSAHNRTATDVEETTDFINEYGDAIVAQFLREHHEIRDFLGLSVPDSDESVPDELALRASGRAALLSVEDQSTFYDDVENNYKAEIAGRNAAGTNRLERRDLDLDAVPLEEAVLVAGEDNAPEVPFRNDAYLTKYEVNTIGTPPTASEVRKTIEASLGGRKPEKVITDIETELASAFEEALNQRVVRLAEYRAGLNDTTITTKEREELDRRIAGVQQELNDLPVRKEQTLSALRAYQIGIGGMMRINDMESFATVTGYAVRKAESKGGNPYSPSNFRINFLRNIPGGGISLPLSRIEKLADLRAGYWRPDPDIDFEYRDRNIAGQRTDAHIITKNIPAAISALRDSGVNPGEIVGFTRRNQDPEVGILMPKNFDPGNLAQQDYGMREPKQIIDYLHAVEHALLAKQAGRSGYDWYKQKIPTMEALRGGEKSYPTLPESEGAYTYGVFSKNRIVVVEPTGQGQYRLTVDKALGARWIKNKTIRDLVGDLSGRRGGSVMRTNFDAEKMAPLVRYLRSQMPLYVLNSKADLARSFLPPTEAKAELGPAVQGLTHEQLRDALRPITDNWKNAPGIIPMASRATSPVPVPVGTRGLFHNGKVYLFASEIPDVHAAQRTILHEVAGHYGLAGIFGNELDGVMQRIYDSNPHVKAAADAILKLYESRGWELSKAGAAEEVLANLASRGDYAKLNGWKMLVAAVRSGLRRLGFDLDMSDNDVAVLLSKARKFVEEPRLPAEGTGRLNEAVPTITAGRAALSEARFAKDGKLLIAEDEDEIPRKSNMTPAIAAMPPEVREALRKTGTWAPQKTIGEKLGELRHEAGLKVITGMVDQFRPVLQKIGKYEYQLLRMSSSNDAGILAAIKYGTPYLNKYGAIDLKPGEKSFREIMAPLKGESWRFLAWVAGHRAERLMAEDREHLFGTEDIAALKTLDGKLHGTDNFADGTDGRERATIYADTLKEFVAFQKSIVDIAEASGLVEKAHWDVVGEAGRVLGSFATQREAEEQLGQLEGALGIRAGGRAMWEHDFYVPFYRNREEQGEGYPTNVSGVVNQWAFKRLKGGTEVTKDLLANTVHNWNHLLSASLKNNAANKTLDKATELGIARKANSVNGEFFTMKEGKRTYYTVDDPLVAQAVKSLEPTPFYGPAMRSMQWFRHALTVGTTASPVFRLRHTIREQITALAANPTSYNFVKNWVDGFKYSSHNNPVYGSMLAGGSFFPMGLRLEDNQGRAIKEMLRHGIDESLVLNTTEKTQKALTGLWDWWKDVGERSDSITRANLYRQEYARRIAAGEPPEKAHFEASYVARDAMDYGLHGAYPAIRLLTRVVPFMNARMQGLYKLGRGAVDDPWRFAAVVGGVTLATIALSLYYRDDKEMDAREEWDKDNNWAFRVGDKMFRIPKPFELGALATVADRALETALNGFDPISRERFVTQLWPIIGSQLNLAPIPQAVSPFIQVWANKDWFRGRAIESEHDLTLTPPNRIGPYTSAIAKGLSSAMYAATPRPFDQHVLSPKEIDWLVNAFFGWVGSHAVATADLALRPLTDAGTKPAPRVDDYFLLGDFVKQLPQDQSRFVESFYTHLKEVQEAFGDLRNAQHLGRPDLIAQQWEERGPDLTVHNEYIRVQRALARLSQLERLYQSKDMDPDVKRERLEGIAKEKAYLATAAESARARAFGSPGP